MKSTKRILLLALIIFLFLIPLFVSNLYYIGVLTTMLINILLVVSFWLVMSTGQVNLGHAAFAAIGAYISAALVSVFGWSSWLALPMGVLTAGVVALILGFITLRITGIYFIIATIALISVVQIVFGLWDHPFGGLVGLLNLPHPDSISIFGLTTIDFSSRPSLYLLTLVFVLIGVVVVYRVYHSSMGRVFRGINSSDRLAEHVGINIMRYKVLAFVISCMCAGLAGVLSTYSTSTIQPTSFTLTQSTYYIVWAAVGGLAYFPGPIIGTVVLSIVSEFLRPVKDYENIIYALLLIGSILVFKAGLYGLIQKTGDLLKKLFKRGKPTAANNAV
jgi:branched-chain amino acid transport system permease protein